MGMLSRYLENLPAYEHVRVIKVSIIEQSKLTESGCVVLLAAT